MKCTIGRPALRCATMLDNSSKRDDLQCDFSEDFDDPGFEINEEPQAPDMAQNSINKRQEQAMTNRAKTNARLAIIFLGVVFISMNAEAQNCDINRKVVQMINKYCIRSSCEFAKEQLFILGGNVAVQSNSNSSLKNSEGIIYPLGRTAEYTDHDLPGESYVREIPGGSSRTTANASYTNGILSIREKIRYFANGVRIGITTTEMDISMGNCQICRVVNSRIDGSDGTSVSMTENVSCTIVDMR